MDTRRLNQELMVDDKATAQAKDMFQRMLVGWAHDSLVTPNAIEWCEPAAIEDYKCEDWSLLYQGDILDD
jgi:hypothetical protein